MGRGRHWTKQEEQALWQGVGVYGVEWFQKNTGDGCTWPGAPKGRTRAAIYAKARRLYGRGGLSRGAFSLRRLMRESGYGITHLRRAMRACAQKWKRTSPRGNYLIHEDQAEEMISWLRGDYWGKRHRVYNCSWCGSSRWSHYAQGLCYRCYQRYARRLLRSGLPVRRKELAMELRRIGYADIAARFPGRGKAVPENTLRRLLLLRRRDGA